MDGKFVPWRDAKIHVLTHTFHYGTGVFEGVRAYSTKDGPAIFRLPEHTSRLLASAKAMGMNVPWTQEKLEGFQKEAVKKNELTDAYIRPMIYYGCQSMGLHAKNLPVHCLIAAWKWGAYLGEGNMEKGISVKTTSFLKLSPSVALCKAKVTGHYFNSTLALNEALADGYDEALLLDAQGFVAECSGENIFFVKDASLHTPDLTYALGGITRMSILKIAKGLGFKCKIRPCTRDELYTCDEVFLTGTAAEITPVREIDRRTIGHGRRGKITTRLQNAYFDAVHGRTQHYRDWLSYV